MSNLSRSKAHTRTLLATLVMLISVGPGVGPAWAGTCPNADLAPTTKAELTRAGKATRCLINLERRKRGFTSLKANSKLAKAAKAHGDDMLDKKYFAHKRADGPDFIDRIRKTGYMKNTNGWSAGENLGWSSEQTATPRQMVKLWLNSPGHRANLLNKTFREIGLVAVRGGAFSSGAYAGAGPVVVYVNEFGVRY